MSISVSNDIRGLFLSSALETVDSVLSSAEERVRPSEEFEKRMRRLLHDTYKQKTARILPTLSTKKWIAISLVAALLLSLVGCAWAHSDEIVEFLQVLFEGEKIPDEESTIKTFFNCTYIPDGFVYDVTGSDSWDADTRIRSIWEYWRNGYSTIRFNQRVHNPNIISQPSQGSQIWQENIGGIERTFWILEEDTLPNDSPAYYSGSMGCFWTDGYCDYEVRFYRFYDSQEITLDQFINIVTGISSVYTLPESDD